MQDRAVISTVSALESGFPADVDIGDNVTIGHGALLTSCVVGSKSLIGQGAIVQAGAEIGSNCVIGAGAVVLPNTVIPNNQLWAGNPAKFIRNVTDEEVGNLDKVSQHSSFLLCFLNHIAYLFLCLIATECHLIQFISQRTR